MNSSLACFPKSSFYFFPSLGPVQLPSPAGCCRPHLHWLARHPLSVCDKHTHALLCTRHGQKLTEGNGGTQDEQTPRHTFTTHAMPKITGGSSLRAEAPQTPGKLQPPSPTQEAAGPPHTHLGSPSSPPSGTLTFHLHLQKLSSTSRTAPVKFFAP